MAKNRLGVEQIIGKLREAELILAQRPTGSRPALITSVGWTAEWYLTLFQG